MRTREQIAAELETSGLIPVIRARSAAQVLPLAQALLRAGMRVIEVTMTTPDALDAVRQCVRELPREALVGVGTVLNRETTLRALEAGAEFIVSPVTRPEIAAAAHAGGKPAMIGAYTPTEAQTASEAGADFIKLFPAETLGPAYIRAIRAPLPHLKIVPTGGVTLENLAEFFRAGCPAVGIGSSLLTGAILERSDWAELERQARRFVEATDAARGGAPGEGAGPSTAGRGRAPGGAGVRGPG